MAIVTLIVALALLLLVSCATAFLVEWRVQIHAAKLECALVAPILALRRDLAVAKLLRSEEPPASAAPLPVVAAQPEERESVEELTQVLRSDASPLHPKTKGKLVLLREKTEAMARGART